MCAASVYPEPGSNSLVFGFISFDDFSSTYIIFSRYLIFDFYKAFCFSNLLFGTLYLGIQNNRFGLFSKGFNCLLFNVLFPLLYRGRFALYYAIFFLSSTFLNFFYFFIFLGKSFTIVVSFLRKFYFFTLTFTDIKKLVTLAHFYFSFSF